jgi:hypothetical protein
MTDHVTQDLRRYEQEQDELERKWAAVESEAPEYLSESIRDHNWVESALVDRVDATLLPVIAKLAGWTTQHRMRQTCIVRVFDLLEEFTKILEEDELLLDVAKEELYEEMYE